MFGEYFKTSSDVAGWNDLAGTNQYFLANFTSVPEPGSKSGLVHAFVLSVAGGEPPPGHGAMFVLPLPSGVTAPVSVPTSEPSTLITPVSVLPPAWTPSIDLR